MFRFTQEQSSGSYNQCLAKITSLVRLCVSVQTLSVVWRGICSHTTDSVCTDTHCRTRLVILAKHWL